MEIYSFLFYFFGFCFILSSTLMIIARNTIKAAMLLILAFFNAAIIWLFLEAEFLAITLILVYVGAVMVLFLFIIKMLDIDKEVIKAKFSKYMPLSIAVLFIIIGLITLILYSGVLSLNIDVPESKNYDSYSNITEIAKILYTDFVYPFELAAVLLLLAIIASITLVHNKKDGSSKRQEIAQQVKVKAKDRMKIIKGNRKNEKED